MRLKTIGAMTVVAGLALLLGGCPESGNTISFWVMPNAENEAHAAWLEKMKDDFLKREGIVVNVEIVSWADSWTRIRDALAAGQGPDVIQLRSSWTAAFAAGGGLAQLNPAEYGGESSFTACLRASARYKGGYFAVPWFGETMALVCDRKTLGALKSAAPRTIEELFTVGKKIAARRGRERALALPGLNSGGLVDIWSIFFYGEGGRYVTEDGKNASFGNEAGVRAVSDYVALYREGLADTATLESGEGADELLFAQGRAAMCFLTASGLRRIGKEAPGKELAVVGTPVGAEGWGTFVKGGNLAIPEKSLNKRKAARWISFLLEDGNLSSYTGDLSAVLPAKKAVLESGAFRVGDWPVFKAALARAVPYPSYSSWMTVEKETSHSLQLILLALSMGRYRSDTIPGVLGKAAVAVDKDLAREAEAIRK